MLLVHVAATSCVKGDPLIPLLPSSRVAQVEEETLNQSLELLSMGEPILLRKGIEYWL